MLTLLRIGEGPDFSRQYLRHTEMSFPLEVSATTCFAIFGNTGMPSIKSSEPDVHFYFNHDELCFICLSAHGSFSVPTINFG